MPLEKLKWQEDVVFEEEYRLKVRRLELKFDAGVGSICDEPQPASAIQ